MILKAGTIKRIHVDRRILAQNKRDGTNFPAITVQTSKGPIKASIVRMNSCIFVQAGINGRKPLSCGARVWVETKGQVVVIK